jgi:hypothetical protein
LVSGKEALDHGVRAGYGSSVERTGGSCKIGLGDPPELKVSAGMTSITHADFFKYRQLQVGVGMFSQPEISDIDGHVKWAPDDMPRHI